MSYDSDGSLTVHVPNEEPSAANQQQNWLPAPDGGFVVVVRVYWPKEPVRNAVWSPPALEKAR